jgi:hypothetical protein
VPEPVYIFWDNSNLFIPMQHVATMRDGIMAASGFRFTSTTFSSLREQAGRDELLELRKEVARLGNLMQQAIASLRAGGQTRDADRLERELGVPVEDLRA